MPLQLKMPTPSAGGFTTSFKLKEPKHVLRVFSFKHKGEDHLAGVQHLHFVDKHRMPCSMKPDCPICAQAKAEDNKDLRRNTKYPMAIVDIENDESVVLRFDAPASVYKAIHDAMKDQDPADFIGNNGVDFIINTNTKALPQDYYKVTARLKGSKTLEIDEDAIPDVIEEAERDTANMASSDDFDPAKLEGGRPAVEEVTDDDAKTVVFKDSKGKKVTGTYNGKKRDGKFMIESDGRLNMVELKQVISGKEYLK